MNVAFTLGSEPAIGDVSQVRYLFACETNVSSVDLPLPNDRGDAWYIIGN